MLVISIYLLNNTRKDKQSFQNITGQIIFLSKTYGNLPLRDTGKFRYIKIDLYDKPFEIFVGSDPGDFKPTLNKIDSLRKGDLITVYFDENDKTINDSVNRLAYYIDRAKHPVFIFSPSLIYVAYFCIGISAIMMVVVLVGKLSGKII